LIIQSSEYRHIRDKDISREIGVVWIENCEFSQFRTCDRVSRCLATNWGLPDDFAGITIFLASAASDFVTGTAIP
jgi:NAD(P)-dependent dehydrogenase (short-subunit alcohol dehydrogenase family)